ncbi:MAG TPA: NAD-dependent epimerase/dehydratase family protein [Paenibacillus sp.]|uniref:NAD-dependent epimerase/dehydratase family protein n=1 Tax=Paenibacillus sp. TaxID=58172 RepID=UPI002BB8347F|nr:NAD-dependent epimerase/dehydratase family protein [Paenibacillus sp.]HUC91998.1 NAD-dependent epimerase/dehydratase family protein [Paenibacillus sp.]
MWKDKKVFISGGAGVIGTALVGKLLASGANVFVGDLKPKPASWPAGVRYRQGDLNAITAEELADFAPEVFFHLAATFERSVETYEFWGENDRHNVRLSHHLIDLMKDMPSLKKVVFASSYLIYNPELYQFPEPADGVRSLKEEDPISPRNLCGTAKLLHEKELHFLSDFSGGRLQTVSARIYRVYGKNSRDIVSRWIQALINGETIRVFRPEGLFDYVYAEDVAEGLFRLAESDAEDVVNLGRGRARRVSEVLDVLQRHFPGMRAVSEESDIPYEASEADMTRFHAVTGWLPKRDLEDTIPEMIEHYRSRRAESAPLQADATVLVSSLSKKIPLLKAVRKAVEKLGLHGDIIGADSNPACIGRHFADRFWEMPLLRDLQPEELIRICRKYGIRAIIPTRDGELAYYASLKSELEEKGIHVMVSDPAAVDICMDKLAFYKWGKEAGVPVIPTAARVEELDGDTFVVKERNGAGSLSVGLKLDPAQAAVHAGSLKEPIFQPFVEGKEISVDLYVDRTGKCKGVILRYRVLVVNGESQITTTFRHEALEKRFAAYAERLGLYGHAVWQAFWDGAERLDVIECNARLGGASMLSLETGLDSIYWFLLESEGHTLDEVPFLRPSTEKTLIRYAEDRIV